MRVRLLIGTLVVALLMLVVGGAAAVSIQRNVTADAQKELFEEANQIARVLGRIETEGQRLRNGQILNFGQRQLVNALATVGNYDYLEVGIVTERGLRIAEDDAVLLPILEGQLIDRAVQQVDVDGEPVNVAIRIIANLDREIVIAIGSRAGVVDRQLFTRPMVIATIVGVLAAISLSFLVSQQLGKRIDALSDAAQVIAAGDFSARVDISGGDEIAALASAFNEMATGLADAKRRERDFLMSVGHDLRTPLTTIRGYAEALDDGRVDAEHLPRVASVLHTQTQRLSRLIEDLMLLSRLEAREFTLRYESVDLTAHLDAAVAALTARAETLHIAVSSDLAVIPLGQTDPDRISQIVGNLVDNALRYTPEGGTITVALGAVIHGTCRISVSDTGPGIDADDLPHVFERLYVAQRYQALRPEGSGLGLAIVQQLVTALGGSVSVESELGTGTTVHVTIPWTASKA